MPLFDWRCPACGLEREELVKLSDTHHPRCVCGVEMEKIFKSFRGFVDVNLGYYDHQLGMNIESTSHLRKVMKERGLEGASFAEIDRHNKKQEKYLDEKRHAELKKEILASSRKRRGA